jgi:hypothetical protein
MTLNNFTAAVRSALAAALGSTWEVAAADDEWAALSLLGGSAPGRYRLVIIAGRLVPEGGDPAGLVCRNNVSMIVQVRRGMDLSATASAISSLMDCEEAVRLHALSLYFQLPGAAAPTAATVASGVDQHPSAGQFRFEGSDIYTPSLEDVALQHPARVLTFSNLVALNSPTNGTLVPVSA